MAAETSQQRDQVEDAPPSNSSAMDEEEGMPDLVPSLEPREEAGAIEQLELAAQPREGDSLYLVSTRLVLC